jgi:hypothetical protein
VKQPIDDKHKLYSILYIIFNILTTKIPYPTRAPENSATIYTKAVIIGSFPNNKAHNVTQGFM